MQKAEKLLVDEKAKVTKSLNELIRKNAKERAKVEQEAFKRNEKQRKTDEKFRRLEENEIVAQEKIAKKMIEMEMLSESKSDEIAYKEIELHKQEARINNALASLKIDQVHVKRYLERLVDEEKKAK